MIVAFHVQKSQLTRADPLTRQAKQATSDSYAAKDDLHLLQLGKREFCANRMWGESPIWGSCVDCALPTEGL
jgi:hypothetical protein